MAERIGAGEKARIVQTLKAGASVGQAVKAHNRSRDSIHRIAKDAGISFECSAMKKATKAKADYDQAARLELLNKVFNKASELLPQITEAKEFRELVTGIAIAVDKRRLEENLPTDRTEHVDSTSRDRIKGTLHDIATMRREERKSG